LAELVIQIKALSLRILHLTSGVVVAAYAALHIANHLAALFGFAAHIAFMQVARLVYRHPVVETVLLACVLWQVLSGVWLVAQGWRRRRGTVAWLQAGAGAYLVFFLVVHVGAVLVGRRALGLDTNIYYAAAGLHVRPFVYFFAPYYVLGVTALVAHLGCAAYWRASVPSRWSAGRVVGLSTAGGAVLALLIVLALAGAFYPVDIPAAYEATYQPPVVK
jgi:hypothetical protein